MKRLHQPLCLTDIPVLTFILILGTWVLWNNALMRYDFFDMSAFMDAGYRVYKGQIPYTDFFYLAGPVHPYMHALFYKIFGFNKLAIQTHVCTISALTVSATYLIARRHEISIFLASLSAILCTFAFYGPISHPWYDQNASFWLVMAVVTYEIGSSYFRSKKLTSLTALICGIFIALSFLTKANVGLAGGITMLAVFAINKYKRAVFAYILGGLMGLALVFATLKSPEAFIYQTFLAYNPGVRLLNWEKLVDVLRFTPFHMFLGLTLAMAVLGGRNYINKNQDRILLTCGLFATSIFTTWTGSMIIPANIVLLGFNMTYVLIILWSLPLSLHITMERKIFYMLTGTVIIGSLVWIASAATRTQRVETWNWRPSNIANYAMTNEPFKGWLCNRIYGEGVDKTVEYINKNIPQKDSLFIFPDATVMYGLTGHESYKKTSFIYQLEHQPSPGKLYEEFRGHFLQEPPQWIVFHHQHELEAIEVPLLLQWLQLQDYIKSHYQRVWAWGEFEVLSRK